MKKLLFLLLLFVSTVLFAENRLDTFIDQQLKIEQQLIDDNVTMEEKVKLKKKQSREFQEFLLQYASESETYLKEPDPYKKRLYKLKLRYNSNKYHGYTLATLRDEILIHNYKIRSSIRDTLHQVIRLTESKSKAFYEEKVNELILQKFSNYKPFNKAHYLTQKVDTSNPLYDELLKIMNRAVYLDSFVNTFASELIDNSGHIYRAVKISRSKLFSLINSINKSSFGHQANIYLEIIHLDMAQLLMIGMIILFIVLVQIITRALINMFLTHKKLKEEDIEYIHSHITNIFNLLTSLIIIHLIIVVALGFESASINISKLFIIIYIILTALILYRVTNTIAYLKMEGMRTNKMLKAEVVNLGIKATNGLIMLIATIAILKILGVDLTAILSGLGIAGAAVAFAAKDTIANIFGSIAILAGDVFEQGDWIETSHASGTVVEIGLRATTIRTFDNAMVSVPNFELSNNGVKNWSRRSIGRRIKMNIGVTYESDFDDIKQAIEEIRRMLKEHPGVANEHTSYLNSDRRAKLVSIEDFKGIKRTTLVYMDEFADSSINILVYCFSRSVVWHEWLEVKEDVMFKIAEILKRNKLEFAYPTMTIHQAQEEKEEAL